MTGQSRNTIPPEGTDEVALFEYGILAWPIQPRAGTHVVWRVQDSGIADVSFLLGLLDNGSPLTGLLGEDDWNQLVDIEVSRDR